MTEQEQNIAIAELCGWKHEIRRSYRETPAWFRGVSMYDAPPDYLNDLNAMHKAEGVLEQLGHTRPSLAYEYDQHWLPLVTEAYDKDTGLLNTWLLFRATARQRAEAFLRTVGKWKDTPDLVQQ